jgi:FKBP-type peptidyl-prolyl cis-trans isomerase FklB
MKTDMNKVSYVLGQSIGGDFRRNGFDVNPDVFAKSFRAAFAGEKPEMPPGVMQQIMMSFQQDLQEKKQAAQSGELEKNLTEGATFLEDNKSKEGIQVTESGLQYKIITEGTGKKPALTDTVVTHYEGKTLDGNVFDSSYKRGTPASFPVNGLIAGWQEALQMMPEGSKWELYIPASLGYGNAGAGGSIGPGCTLVFTMELIKVE